MVTMPLNYTAVFDMRAARYRKFWDFKIFHVLKIIHPLFPDTLAP